MEGGDFGVSKQLDERVVSMKFDNKQFEQGIKQTQSSLQNFNNALNFDKAVASIGSVSKAAQNVKMDAIVDATEQASSGFKAFEVAAITVLANITSKVVDSALQWGKKLVFDAPVAGFKEYETQVNAVQTILANTIKEGTNVQIVNKYLDELNDYADKTIYNFSEMTRNIGTFTAAGVKLEPAVKSVKGLANVAALTGTNSEKASGAMYQMSQAMAAGRVALQDWISMEQAGMGGQQVQELIKDTARAMGLVDKLDKKTRDKFENGSFRESLKGGWLTADVMTRALEVMNGEMSKADLMARGYTESQAEYYEKLGQTALKAATEVKTLSQLRETLGEALGTGWAQTWRIIFGDFEEAKELFTWLSDAIGGAINRQSEARNRMFQDWKDLGGRTAVVNGLRNILQAIANILAPIGRAWRTIFPPTAGATLAKISQAFERFTAKLVLSEPAMTNLQNIFQGLFAVFHTFVEIISAVTKGVAAFTRELLGTLPKTNGSILQLLGNFGSWVNGMLNVARTNDLFLKKVQEFGDWVHHLAAIVAPYVQKVVDAFVNLGRDAGKGLDAFVQRLKAIFDRVRSALTGAAKATAESTNQELDKIGQVATPKAVEFAQKLKAWLDKLIDRLNTFKDAIKSVWKESSSSFDGLKNPLRKLKKQTDVGNDVNDALVTTNLAGSAGVVTMLALLIKNLSSGFDKISKGFKSVGDVLTNIGTITDGLREHLKALTGEVKAKTLLTLALAIGALALSVLLLASIDPGKLTKGLIAVGALLATLTGTLLAISKMDGLKGGQFTLIGLGLLTLSLSVTILASALRKLGELEPKKLVLSVVALDVILGALVATIKAMPDDKRLKGVGIAMVSIGFSLLIVSKAVKKMSEIKATSLIKGVAAIIAVLTALALFITATNQVSVSGKVGTQMLEIAAALLVITKAIEFVGRLKPEQALQGVAAITAILGVLALVSVVTSKYGGGKSAGLMSIALSLLAIAAVVKILGEMKLEDLAKGLGGLAVALGLMIGFVALIGKMAPSAIIGLLALSVALATITTAIAVLGAMDVMAMVKALGALAATLGILTVGMWAMSKVKPSMKSVAFLILLSAAIALLVPSILLLGSAPIKTIALGLGTIIVAILALAGVAALVAPVTPAIQALSLALLAFAAAVAVFSIGVLALGVGLSILGTAGGAGIQVLVTAITSLISLLPFMAVKLAEGIVGMIVVFGEKMPEITTTISLFIGGMIQVFIDNVPKFVEAAVVLISALLDGLVELIPKLVDAGMKLLLGLLRGIRDNIGEVTKAVGEIITNFLKALGEALPEIIDAGFKFIIAFINGLAQAIDNNHRALIEAMIRLGASMLTALWNAIKEAFKSIGGLLFELGRAIIRGIWEGIKSLAGWLKEKVAGIGQDMVGGMKHVLGVRSPSREFKKIGRFAMQGLGLGIEDGSAGAISATEKAGQELIDAVNDIFKGVDLEDLSLEISPVVSPVLDLAQARAGAESLNNLFNSQQTIRANVEAARPRTPEPPQQAQAQTVNRTTEINFTQNNTSPEALSAIDIYRNTQNQLRQIREAALSY